MSSSFTDNCVNLMRTEAGFLVCKGLNKKAKYCGPGSSCPFYKNEMQDTAERQRCRDRLYSLNLISRFQYRKQGGGDLL